ncbi:MAG: hypothetical protein COA63_007255 [Methylophaga sp.]|nr:hypothetical protein [Methylophaga sp.]
MIANIFKSLIALVTGFFQKKYKVVQAEDEPIFVTAKTVYMIGENGFYVYALLMCPCGCKNKIYLNLIPGSKPTWKISVEGKTLTISPSIWGKSGCKSHFFIRLGEIVWA